MYGQPKRAKRLYFDVIPKAVDEYFTHLGKISDQRIEEGLENPAWHINLQQTDRDAEMPVSFSLLLNLAAVCSAETADELWGYIQSYAPGTTAQTHPHLDKLAAYAVRFYQDRVRPDKKYRAASAEEKTTITVLGCAGGLPEMQKPQMFKALSAQQVKIDTRICVTGLNVCMKRCWSGTRPAHGQLFPALGLSKSVALCDAVLADQLTDDGKNES